MELREMIEEAAKKKGGLKELAEAIDVHANNLTNAKRGARGLPVVACGKLADILGIDRWTVIAASDLVTEKDEKRRAYLLPFVRQAAMTAGFFVLANVTNVMTTGDAEAAEMQGSAGESSQITNYAKL